MAAVADAPETEEFDDVEMLVLDDMPCTSPTSPTKPRPPPLASPLRRHDGSALFSSNALLALNPWLAPTEWGSEEEFRGHQALLLTALLLLFMLSSPMVLAVLNVSLPATWFLMRKAFIFAPASALSYALLFHRVIQDGSSSSSSSTAAPQWKRVGVLFCHSVLLLVGIPLAAIALQPGCATSLPGAACWMPGVLHASLLVHAGNALLSVFTFPAIGAMDVKQAFRVHCSMLLLFCQLAFTFWLGGTFGRSQLAMRVLLCSLFPLAISSFKLAIGLLIPANSPLLHMMYNLSLLFAALPYRLLFFSMKSWDIFFAIVGVEIVFKICAYAIPLSLPLMRLRKHVASRLQFLKPALSCLLPTSKGRGQRTVSPARTVRYASSADFLSPPRTPEARELSYMAKSLSIKFFVHQLADIAALVNIGFGLVITRVIGSSIVLNAAVPVDVVPRLAGQYGLMFLLELAIIGVTTAYLQRVQGHQEFRPLQLGIAYIRPLGAHFFANTLLIVLFAYNLMGG